MKDKREKSKPIKKPALLCLGLVAIILLVAGGVQVARAEWQEPELAPPLKSIPAPITVGDESQSKAGYLELNPSYNPTEEDSLIFDPQKPLHVKGSEGALFSSPYVFDETLTVDTDTLYVDALDGWMGVGTTEMTLGKRLKVVGGTVRVGTDLAPISGRAVSAYSNTVGIYGEADVGAIAGVYGLKNSSSSVAVQGVSQNNVGVRGESVDGAGIYAANDSAEQAAVFGQNYGTGWAGYFEGNLGAGGDIVTNSFLPTNLQQSLIPFTSGQQVAEYDFGTWTADGPDHSLLAYDGKYIWIGTDRDDSPLPTRNLFKVRASDGQVVKTYRIGWSVLALTWDGQYLWILDTEGHIYRFDPQTDTYLTIPRDDTGIAVSQGAEYLAVSTSGDQTYIWALEDNDPGGEYNLVRIKADAEAPFADDIDVYDLTSSTLIPNNPGIDNVVSLTYDGQYIWVSSQTDGGYLLKLWAEQPDDPAHPGLAVDTNTGSYKCFPVSLVFDGEYVWCTPAMSANNQIVRIWAEDPDDPQHPIQGYGLFNNIYVKAVAVDGQYLWAATLQQPSTLYRYLLADPDQVVAYSNVADDPYRMVFDGTYLWLADASVMPPKLHKIFSGTGLGDTSLNTVANLTPAFGFCSSNANFQCLSDADCPGAGVCSITTVIPSQAGNFDIDGSAEISREYCHNVALNKTLYGVGCSVDNDCVAKVGADWVCQEVDGGNLSIGQDISVSGNTWQTGTEQTVGLSGDPKTAACPEGTFMKGINVDSNQKLDSGSIICQGL